MPSCLLALILLVEAPIAVGGLHVQLPDGVVAETREADEDDVLWGRAHVTRVEGTDARGVSYRLARLEPHARPHWPKRRADWLRRWRAGHACTARFVDAIPPSRRGKLVPPQMTFAGSCEGGDRYVMRVLVVDRVAYELHVDHLARAGGAAVSEAELGKALARLVAGASLD
jgi:hypothetical protein